MAKKKSAAAKALASFPSQRADAFEMVKPEKGQTPEALLKLFKRGDQRLDDWANVLTGAGVAGADRRMAGQANWTGIMQETEAEQLYASGELERRIVELVPRECLKNWIKFTGMGDDEMDVQEELDRLQAQAKFTEASNWANVYGGSALFMATGEDPEDFKKPLDPRRFRKVESLVLFSRWELLVKSTDLENDINDPNYGKPKYYWLTPRKGNISNLFSVRIHHSRLIIFGGKPLPLRLKVFNRYWDDSIYSGIKGVLRDYGISHASIASVMQEFRQVVYKIKELTEGLGSVDGDSIKSRLSIMNAVKSVFGAYVLDMDEEVEIHSDTFAGVADMLQAMKDRLQACTPIPHIILFNESPGGKSSMGSTGDSSLENWYSYLEGHQKNYYAPKIDQLLAVMLQAAEGPTAGLEPEGWDWEFNKIQSMDEGAAADLESKQYDNDAKAQGLGIDSSYDTLQKRRPEKFKQLGLTDKDLLQATLQQLVRSEMEKFGTPGDLEGTGGSGLDMSDPLFQTRSASPATSGPQQARGKKRSDEELADIVAMVLKAVRLDMNENHDPANGEFSSAAGASAKESGRGGIRERVNNHLQTPPKNLSSVGRHDFEQAVRTGSFSMLTPANPASTPLNSKENAERMREGIKELKARGASFTVMVGKYGHPEATLMVQHGETFSKQDARDLGKKWGQTSVMHVEGGKAMIYHTTGDFAGRVQRSNGLSFDPHASDNYTGHGNHRYSFSFPDESWANPEKE